MTAPAISMHDVDVGYRSRPLFVGLQLEISKGSFHAILGPNGAGKTTLLKTLAGILPSLRGRVEFSGESGHVGYVPQKEQLDPIFLLSAEDVALMGACARVRPGRFLGNDVRDEAMAALKSTGADGFASERFSRLSGGQKQRVLIARALMTRPDVLILDEPTAGLDTAASESILQLLLKLQAERAKTILMVTHDLPQVRRHLREAIWVNDGRVERGEVKTLLSSRHVGEMLGIALE